MSAAQPGHRAQIGRVMSTFLRTDFLAALIGAALTACVSDIPPASMADMGTSQTMHDASTLDQAKVNVVDMATMANIDLAAQPDLATPPDMVRLCTPAITVAVDPNNPAADVAVTGTGPVAFTTYHITPTCENSTLTGAPITTTHPNDIEQVFVTYKNKAGKTVSRTAFLSGNTAVFNDGELDAYLPVNQATVITVGAYIATVQGGANPGDEAKIGFAKTANQFGPAANLTNNFVLLGEASNSKTYGNTNNVTLDDSNVNAQTIHKTRVTVKESDQKLPVHTTVPQDPIGVFTFTSTPEPGSFQNSKLTSITVALAGNLIGAGVGDNEVAVHVYSGPQFDDAHLMGTGVITGLDASKSNDLTIMLAADNEFSADRQIYVVANSTDSDFVDSDLNIEKLTVKVSDFSWNDGVVVAAPVTGLPVFGDTYTY